GDVLCIRIPEEIKTEPDGEDYMVSEATSASQSLSEGYPGCSAAQSENSGSGNEVESGGLPSGSKPLKSLRKQAKKRLSSHTSAGGRVTTNASPPYCCKLCGSTFVYIGPLVNHVKNVHTKLTAEYRCGVCEEVFESIAKIKTEPDGEDYTVSEATSASQSLSEGYPGCSAAQSENSGSGNEVESGGLPSGSKPLKSPRKWASTHNRARGKVTTNASPYCCKLCGSTFVYIGPLVNHVKNVHTKHTKMCGVCEEVFESIA
ncbi:unnamed protein product, partial [Coregonus sp. 'balchen']